MKVILLKDVDHLGRIGDVKEVAPGYARNFLLPRSMVVEANAGQMKRLEQLQRQRQKEDVRRLTEAQQLAARLEALEVNIPARVGEQGRLFGSVTNQDVAAALIEQHGITLDRRDVELADPIRALGTHQVTVRLGGEVRAQVRVNVVEEGGQAPAAAAAGSDAGEAVAP
ncbi:MAG TPA: 50S ribosomal protein L9 [Chloroflexota bacterium]|jgi:large subunit ribosomal protein L9|nr:50S ribosomal protein L9 [Chloroflexota bacterium]